MFDASSFSFLPFVFHLSSILAAFFDLGGQPSINFAFDPADRFCD
jgi:hypothetical protein